MMLDRLTAAVMFTLVATLARCDEPPAVEGHELPQAVGEPAPSQVVHSPDVPASQVLKNGMNTIPAGVVRQRHADGKIICILTGEPRIEHAGQLNGPFTVSANTIRFSIPQDHYANPRSVSLDNLDADGSCTFCLMDRPRVLKLEPVDGQSPLLDRSEQREIKTSDCHVGGCGTAVDSMHLHLCLFAEPGVFFRRVRIGLDVNICD